MTDINKILEAIKAVDDQIFVKGALYAPTFDLIVKRQSLVAMLPYGVEPLTPTHLIVDEDQEAADAEYEDNYSL